MLRRILGSAILLSLIGLIFSSGCLEEEEGGEKVDGYVMIDIGILINETSGYLLVPLPFHGSNSTLIYPPPYLKILRTEHGMMMKISVEKDSNEPYAYRFPISYDYDIDEIDFESSNDDVIKVYSSFEGEIDIMVTFNSGHIFGEDPIDRRDFVTPWGDDLDEDRWNDIELIELIDPASSGENLK